MNGLGTNRDAERLERLKRHLREGGSRYSFAKAEGITRQALQNWIMRRPEYALQVKRFLLSHRSAPVTGAQYWQRVEAIRQRQAQGLQWKVVARDLGMEWTALKQWYYQNRADVDGHIASRCEHGQITQGRAA